MLCNLFKNALFLWDKIEYIAPDQGFQSWSGNAELDGAVRTYGERHIPSGEEKQQANEAILDLLRRPLPAWFYVKDIPARLRYTIYPKKFDPETWDRLTSEKLAQPIGDGFQTSAPLGLTIMSILADCCAGSQKRLVTDEAASYSALDHYLATIGGAELGKFDKSSERLVTISLRIMNFQNVPLAKLVKLREKERSRRGAHLTVLRHGYLKKVEEYGEKLVQAKTKRDAREIERVFEQEMRKDLDLLQDELKDEAKKVFFSAEMATAAIGLAGALVHPSVGFLLGGKLLCGGALYRKKVEYRSARNKTLKGHAMSWFYSMKRLQVV